MLHILGIGFSHPTNVIDNPFIEQLNVGTNEAWILDKIGIRERRTSLPLSYISETRNQDAEQALAHAENTPHQLGVNAATMAMQRAGISPHQIGMVICNCCTPKEIYPSEAQRLADALGITAPVVDVFTACPAFALHCDYLDRFDESALPDYILALSTATLTQHVNYNDRSDGAIWGDGAAAWVVAPRARGRLKVLETYFASDPTRSQAVVVDTYGHFHQDGRAVRDFSVRQTVRLVKRLEEKFNLDWKRDIFIGHQANATMLEQICNNRDIPPQNHWHNVSYIGNQAGAGAPAVLGMHWDMMKPGQRIAVAVVGAGLSWGSVLLEVVS
ncbi:MAG: 3-oxoacyl-[acyl-carrier-protein] synthase III C-terminal domain-containing protein [Bdellovibrionota bacterium]|nr:MAG: 3-oxoacyl-[acyl-carrier-protein] synthase III C-terminal domain-containing protein [Bdellovibrionota bacterium]